MEIVRSSESLLSEDPNLLGGRQPRARGVLLRDKREILTAVVSSFSSLSRLTAKTSFGALDRD
jgi:hypothetical protein